MNFICRFDVFKQLWTNLQKLSSDDYGLQSGIPDLAPKAYKELAGRCCVDPDKSLWAEELEEDISKPIIEIKSEDNVWDTILIYYDKNIRRLSCIGRRTNILVDYCLTQVEKWS